MRVQHDLSDPLDSEADLIALRRTIMAAVNEATNGLRPGPVQINMPLWGINCATEPDTDWNPTVDPADIRAAVPAIRLPAVCAAENEVRRAAHRIGVHGQSRGLIFCGPDTCASPQLIDRIARRTGFPVIADAASGIRKKGLANLVTVSDALPGVPDIMTRLTRTELLIRFGGPPTTPIMTSLSKSIQCPTLRVSRADPGPDFWTREAVCLRPIDTAGADVLADYLGQGDVEWLAGWMQIEQRLAARRREAVATLPWGDVLAASLACNAPGYGFIHIGNSLATRQSNLLSEGFDLDHREFIARGMAGTDGAFGMFLGEALGTRGRGLLLIGDHSATHDLPALANPHWRSVKGALVVINNAGAGIFDTLACAQIDGYRAVMRNQPNIKFQHVAAAFELGYRRCTCADEFSSALADAANAERVILIEAVTPPETTPRDLPVVLRHMAS
jgi:2-succinyl-5-enolpyruvyl-6-hydroxy-3-cyclohexene-1-carboxylate synthase